jgi:hypothetical protein
MALKLTKSLLEKDDNKLPSRLEVMCDDPKLKLQMEKQILKALKGEK